MKNKPVRNTVAGRWAADNGYSIHKAIIYRHRLKQNIRFGCAKTGYRDTFLTCLDKPYYHFAIYYRQDGEWLLYGINDYWEFRSEYEVAEFANKHLIPFYELDSGFANMCKVPNNAVQLLRINKQRIK